MKTTLEKKPRSFALVLLLLLLAAPRAQAVRMPGENDEWTSVKVEDITIFTDSKPHRAVALAEYLLQLRDALRTVSRGLERNDLTHTRIFAFHLRERFLDYTPFRDGKPSESYGAFHQPTVESDYIVMPLVGSPDVKHAIQHEFVHAWLSQNLPAVPTWIGEGLAEYYGLFQAENGHALIGIPAGEHVQWLRHNKWIPIRTFLSVTTNSPLYYESNHQGTYYAQSWAFLHYILSTEARRGQLFDYMDAVARGVDPAAACIEAFGVNVDTLEKEVRDHVDAESLHYYRVPLQNPQRAAARIEPMSRAKILVELGDFLCSMRATAPGAIEQHYREVLTLDPSNSRARAGLARHAWMDGRPSDGREWAREALQYGPDDPRALAIAGIFDLESARTASDPAATVDLALSARDRLQRSLQLRPNHVFTMYQLAQTHLLDRTYAEGLRVIQAAVALQPNQAHMNATHVWLLSLSGEVALARQVYETQLVDRADAQNLEYAEEGLVMGELELARTYIEAGRGEEAIAVLENLRGSLHDEEGLAYLDELVSMVRVETSRPAPPRTFDAEQERELERAGELARAKDYPAAMKVLRALLQRDDLVESVRSRASELLDVLETL